MDINEKLPADVIEAALQNRKIDAIKLLREHHKIDLKDAKDIIDVYMETNKTAIKPVNTGESYGLSTAFLWIVIGILGYVVYRFTR